MRANQIHPPTKPKTRTISEKTTPKSHRDKNLNRIAAGTGIVLAGGTGLQVADILEPDNLPVAVQGMQTQEVLINTSLDINGKVAMSLERAIKSKNIPKSERVKNIESKNIEIFEPIDIATSITVNNLPNTSETSTKQIPVLNTSPKTPSSLQQKKLISSKKITNSMTNMMCGSQSCYGASCGGKSCFEGKCFEGKCFNGFCPGTSCNGNNRIGI